MKPRKNKVTGQFENALSCTRLRLTSPRELLGQLSKMNPQIDPTGWRVGYFRLRDVLKIDDGDNGKMEVLVDPRLEPPVDLGHCGIYGANGSPCPRSKRAAHRLAMITTMLTDEQVQALNAGDSIT